MSDNRTAHRKRVLKAGVVQLADTTVDCMVRNISEAGAALEVFSPLFIPDRFMLNIKSDQVERSCRVVWRKEKRLGVVFD
jgi:hypothetical protein